ncbi:hypothetical protein GGQ13_000313 [Salinibacter ruber]|uniref:DUF262 domain-containing protein n=1 Tax=Salinibacter ruber TaxID=146919 RepID=UPI00216823C8|nr:DUF262 domain-containing HNH endonuclease family protein [Salinibacter ruber]MCS4136909.1 hypothetical protein [Salinibacter ruber]
MADSGTKNLGSIFKEGLFRIPNYQRGYAWSSKQVNEFLDDLEHVYESEGSNKHYLNSIIVEGESDGHSFSDKIMIIDGQQRIITSALVVNEILQRIYEIDEEIDDAQSILLQAENKLYSSLFRRSKSDVNYRVLPARKFEEIYKTLVLTEEGREDRIDKAKEKSKYPSEEKLSKASNVIGERIDNIIGEEGTLERLISLHSLTSTLLDNFTATLHEVETESEAGRIFEAINDRGKDLNRADKIKSYLVYESTHDGVNVDVEWVHRMFTEIYEIINRYASTPSETDRLIDSLIGHHWTMFAGETQIESPGNLQGRHRKATEEIEQIKYAKYHLSQGGDADRKTKWIESYVQSLRKSSDAYVKTTGIEKRNIFDSAKKYLSDDVDEDKVRTLLYAINEFMPSNVYCLLMALNLRYENEKVYEEVLYSLEKLAMRMYAIGGARRDTKRNDFESLSRTLFWTGRSDLKDVYPEDSPIVSSVETGSNKYRVEGSTSDAGQVIDRVEEWAYKYSHRMEDGREVDTFRERLANHNLSGLGVPNWGGIRSRELKNYLLYRYEHELRKGGAQLRDYLKSEIDQLTVEHVWPKEFPDGGIESDISTDEYEHYIERIGNLALLSLSDNSSAGNEDYYTKWKKAYDDAGDGTMMFREEFPNPIEKSSNKAHKEGFESWSKDLIEWRSKRIAEELSRHWSTQRSL